MASDSTAMTAADYLQMIRRRWYLPVLGVVLAVAAALVTSSDSTATYRAEARVRTTSGMSTKAIVETLESGTADVRLIATEGEIIRSQEVRDRAMAAHPELGNLPTPTVNEIGKSDVVGVLVTTSDPDRSAAAANAYVEAYLAHAAAVAEDLTEALEGQLVELVEEIDGLEPADPMAQVLGTRVATVATTLGELDVASARRATNTHVLVEAEPPGSPLEDDGPKRLIAAGIVGLIAGLTLIAVIEIWQGSTATRRRPDEAGSEG